MTGGLAFHGASRSVLSFSFDDDTWREEPPMSFERVNHSMASVGDRLFVFGGGELDFSDIIVISVPAVEVFEPLSGTAMWTTCKAELRVQSGHVAVVDRSIYIVGGHDVDLVELPRYGEVQIYSPDEDRFVLNSMNGPPLPLFKVCYCVLQLPQFLCI